MHNAHDLIQVALYFGILFCCAPFFGRYIARVFQVEAPLGKAVLGVEGFLYKVSGINPCTEMHWSTYLGSLLFFNAIGIAFVFFLQMFQQHLGLNPQHFGGVEPLLAFNTAVSFVTNTNWQAYSGEAILSYATQMLGLAVQNFLSAATGLAVMVALARGISRQRSGTLGNFWTDVVKATLYILLPLSFVLAVVLVGQGVVQSFEPYTIVHPLSGGTQVIPLGPAASQIAIKQMGTNGGGFFGVNSAHPFENPTPISNFLEMLSLVLIAAAQVFAFGRLIGNKKHGYALFAVMAVLLVAGFGVAWHFESHAVIPGTAIHAAMEGKEVRFGIVNSTIWETATTAVSNGSVNAMHDSFSPIAGMVAIFNMMVGEVIFGGVGSGVYGMILFVLLTIFLVGLMVGRTPEYLGKKIEAREMSWTMAGLLIPNLLILFGTALAVMHPAALASICNPGPHGFSEIIYAFTSAANNNGSAFGGLSVNTPFYNLTLAVCMLVARFGIIASVLVIAGSLARRTPVAVSRGTFHADTPLFAVILCVSIFIVAALTFVPMFLLGPVLEHLLLHSGMLF